jgi:hypothetical protein
LKVNPKKFDQKFGPDFLAQISTGPGIYRVFDAADILIYVGKAKNLRRRLGQYRNAKRRKKHLKMRSVVQDAARIETELHESDFAACIAETEIIQSLRPRLNVAGAFYFLYPMIGTHFSKDGLELIYTTEPDLIDEKIRAPFSFHGAFRSRFLTGGGFFALVELLEYIGHKNKTKKLGKHSYHYSFRQIDETWLSGLNLFFAGESSVILEKLILSLVENGSARRRAKEMQGLVNQLKRFWRHEAQLLKRVRARVGHVAYPVPQRQRDVLFLEHRYREQRVKKESTAS